MQKVKTFTAELSIFKTIGQLEDLDNRVNDFLQQNSAKVISVSDTTTTDDAGKTMGIIRVLTFEDSD